MRTYEDFALLLGPYVTNLKSGGSPIHIKKANEGKFTASAKSAGMGVQEYAKKVLNDPNASGLEKKRANFARNAAKWNHKKKRKHAQGGYIDYFINEHMPERDYHIYSFGKGGTAKVKYFNYGGENDYVDEAKTLDNFFNAYKEFRNAMIWHFNYKRSDEEFKTKSFVKEKRQKMINVYNKLSDKDRSTLNSCIERSFPLLRKILYSRNNLFQPWLISVSGIVCNNYKSDNIYNNIKSTASFYSSSSSESSSSSHTSNADTSETYSPPDIGALRDAIFGFNTQPSTPAAASSDNTSSESSGNTGNQDTSNPYSYLGYDPQDYYEDSYLMQELGSPLSRYATITSNHLYPYRRYSSRQYSPFAYNYNYYPYGNNSFTSSTSSSLENYFI